MKLLNPKLPKMTPRVYPRGEPAEVRNLVVDGRVATYDTNDMSVHLLDEGEEPPVGSNGELQCPPIYHPQVLGLVLCISDTCNLRCDYCYVWREAETSRSVKVMSDRTVLRSIALLGCPPRNQPVTVSFFGGEPLTAWATVRFAVEQLDHLASITGAKISKHVTTNGTLLDDAKARYLVEHDFGLIVSIDGTKAHHDSHRLNDRGVGSYDAVVAGLWALKRAKTSRPPTLRGTFAPGECERTPECLQAMNDLCDEGLGGSVAWEPAAVSEWNCSGRPGDYAPDEIERFMVVGTDWCIARAKTGKKVRWAYLQNTLMRLVNRQPGWTECGAGTGLASVNPDGAIHACHLRCGAIGNVQWGYDEIARAAWLDPRLTAHRGCGSCWARRLCGGGCRAFNLKSNGDVHKPATIYCKLAKAKARQAIRALVELRDDPDAFKLLMGGDPKTCASDCSAKPAG